MRVAASLALVLAIGAAAWWLFGTGGALAPPAGAGTAAVAVEPVAAAVVPPAPAHAPPSREAVVAAPSPAPAPMLRVRVRDEATAVLAGARVWLCDSQWGGGAVTDGVAFVAAGTGADGVARFDAPRDAFDTILVLANGRTAVIAPRTVRGGDQDVVVGARLAISGLVVVDGGRPGDPIELIAHGPRGDEDLATRWCAAAVAALALLDGTDPRDGWHVATCDAGGRFQFFGLPAGGEFVIAPRVREFKQPGTDRARPSVTSTAPATGVLLELARVPLIRGRPVLPEGVPVEGREQVFVRPRFLAADGGYREMGSSSCRLGEQFSVAVFDEGLASVELAFRFGRGNQPPVVARRAVPCPFAGVHDLGDVLLDERSVGVEVQVVDRHNAPIAGARALVLDKLSEPAGADGRLRAMVGAAPAKFVAGAKGFRPRWVDVPDPAPQPLVVVLEAANRLRIEAHAADARTRLPELTVSLDCAEFPAGEDFGDEFEVSELRGARVVMMSASEAVDQRYFDLAPGQELEVCDVPVGIVFTVCLRDRFGHEIGAERVALHAAEQRTVRFVVSRTPRRLAGQVVDAEGKPIRGVAVSVGSFDRDERVTDADGRFQVDDVYAEATQITFAADGFRSLMVKGADLFQRGTFRLERAP